MQERSRSLARRTLGLALLLIAAPFLAAPSAAFHPAIRTALFPVPESLQPNVEFWVDIYSRYSSDQVLIHDERHLEVVYEVVDLADLTAANLSDSSRARARRKRVRAAEERTRALLRRLAADPQAAGDGEARIRDTLAHLATDARAYRDASWRVRSQTGLRNRFAEAIEISGRFVPGIRRILEAEGVPVEIVCMPFVESMFNYRARSKVGASGAWQFTYATGRQYLAINAAVDERSDVLLAARGAARKLRKDYERLRTWPLALTAYNHGSAGMARAVRRLGTRDLGVIAERYRSRTFGFASRNFYAEFLAALIVYSDRERLFPGVLEDPELKFDEFAPPRYVSLPELSERAGTTTSRLRELNPALTGDVFAGTLMVPKGYRLRVPAGSLLDFEQAYAAIPAERKYSRQLVSGYRVRPGDTLSVIAARYGTTVSAIQQANGLPRADRIYVGQYLTVPTAPRVARASRPAGPRPPSVHVVRPGETLARISSRYGASEAELVASNRLANPDLIRVGQRLQIPGNEPPVVASSGTHVVRRGDTLFRIALLYGTTVDTLVRLNRLSSSLIQVGQVLRIPGGE